MPPKTSRARGRPRSQFPHRLVIRASSTYRDAFSAEVERLERVTGQPWHIGSYVRISGLSCVGRNLGKVRPDVALDWAIAVRLSDADLAILEPEVERRSQASGEAWTLSDYLREASVTYLGRHLRSRRAAV